MLSASTSRQSGVIARTKNRFCFSSNHNLFCCQRVARVKNERKNVHKKETARTHCFHSSSISAAGNEAGTPRPGGTVKRTKNKTNKKTRTASLLLSFHHRLLSYVVNICWCRAMQERPLRRRRTETTSVRIAGFDSCRNGKCTTHRLRAIGNIKYSALSSQAM